MPAMQITSRLRAVCLAALAGLMLGFQPSASAQNDGQPQLNLPRTTLSAGMHRIDAQVAATPVQRQIGLMHRREMPLPPGLGGARIASLGELGVWCARRLHVE